MDDHVIRRPHHGNEPRQRTRDDGTIEKWCGECGAWGDHLRANHPSGGVGAEAGNFSGVVHQNTEVVDVEVDGSVLARLTAAELS